MDELIRNFIVKILRERKDLLKIAVKQRSKFEGWLKFELASYLDLNGMENVNVESLGFGKERTDITFFYEDEFYEIELKTPNTNWKIPGIENNTRPITKNIKSIIKDTHKLNSKNGIVAFVLFPIPNGDNRWEKYLSRISKKTDLNLNKQKNCEVITQKYEELITCDLIVCTYLSKYYGMR